MNLKNFLSSLKKMKEKSLKIMQIKDNKGTALIVALMMALILFLISSILLEFVNFHYLDTSTLYEREKLKLISEREILKTFLSLKDGTLSTNSYFETNTDNFVYKVSREIFKTNNLFYVNLKLESNKAKITRTIIISFLFPTDFCHINLGKLKIQSNTKAAFWGYSYIKEAEGYSPESFFAFTYPPIFSDNTNIPIKSYIAEATISPETPSLNIRINYPTNLINEIKLNIAIDKIIENALKIVDKEWIIREYSDNVELIINPLISKKTLIGRFSYKNPSLKINTETLGNIYFSFDKNRALTIEDTDVYGSRGEYLRRFIKLENNALSFITEPVSVNLPIECFDLYKIKLDRNFLKIDSKYRKITGIFFDNTNSNLLGNGVILKEDSIQIISEEVKNRYYFLIGIGDGKKNRYKVGNTSIQKVFVNGKPITGFYIENGELVLPQIPKEGEEIVAMKKIPKTFFQKRLPPNGVYVFTDTTEKAVVIDFDKIQNLPKNKIIFSELPTIVKGNPNEPVIVISKENIYVDNINETHNPKTLVLISGKGIFIKEHVEVLRNVIIVSRLDGLYRISEFRRDDVSLERNKWIFGTVILTGELENSSNLNSFEKYILSYENPINNSTFSISERVMKDYLREDEFGKNIRTLLPPFYQLLKVK